MRNTLICTKGGLIKMDNFISSVCSTSVFVVFAIACLGYMLGGVKIKGIEIGTAGVLVIALIFGHFSETCQFQVPSFVTSIGTVLFVGSVGFIAGPNFFRNFKQNAKSYILLGIIIILSGFASCVAIIKLFNIPAPLASGILTGALTSTPGLSAASEAARAISPAAENMVAVGYGVAYPFGVIGVVLFVQLMPKLLCVDMDQERRAFLMAEGTEPRVSNTSLFSFDPTGMFPLCLSIAVGIIIGKISIPLPGGASFSLGITGGPLISGLIISHYGHIGNVNLSVDKRCLAILRELGLCLFLIGAGFKGGAGFVQILKDYGAALFIYGAIITLLPMIIGYFVAKYALRLNLLNNLGSICGGMTSTPALGILISVAETDDVATAYAATYPIALVSVVLCAQFVVLLF